MVILSIIDDPIPTKQLLPIFVLPPILTPGQIFVFLSIIHSCSIIDPVLIIVFSAI